MGKKKDKKHPAVGLDLEEEVKRLRKENARLRKRLKKIADLADQGDLENDSEAAESGVTGEELDQITVAEEASPVPAV